MPNWCPIVAAKTATPFVKKMIHSGNTVSEIKQSLRNMGIPVSAYTTLLNQGLIKKWRKQKNGKLATSQS